ncbi:MAG TPA: hypothetical protein IGS53_24820 [Leptolyngbyaceae cyanobacterium M33_DOE_097]|uniref:Uncharacterized protein n=1 Tax=Oscillatoriales cyanobacterium SpSt-418 TaxID=2282169 RepID=A0A7C3KF14_9CYAN|nr:hypothetical protein [Leptolyngbyaceae cyanobacterium M33_DOE_097]
MPSHAALQQQIKDLEAQVEAIKSQGDYLIGVRLERSPAGGTASQNAKESSKYARLRAGRGKVLPNGKKSRYVPVEQIARYTAACQRGEQIQKLERQIERLKAQADQLEQAQYRNWKTQKRSRRKPTIVNSEAVNLIEIGLSSMPASPAAILVLYRQASDAPVHAVAAEVWQGEERIAVVKAFHCMGMRADKVQAQIKHLLGELHQKFGVTRFEDVVKEMPVEQCPLVPCPYKVEP